MFKIYSFHIYNTGFEINPRCRKDYRYRYVQWQFLYSLLATYGLRVHEAWNIKNWDEPVTLKNGEWIAIRVLILGVLREFTEKLFMLFSLGGTRTLNFLVCSMIFGECPQTF